MQRSRLRTGSRSYARSNLSAQRYGIGLALVLALALFMRFWHLASLPPGLHPDEAANGIDILRILHHHWITPFSPTNGGRETLFFYLQAIFVGLFGNTIVALRIAPALIGTAAVGVTYLWAASWFGKRVGLLAALFLAVTPWAVIISRDGFRAGMVALMVPLILWLYTMALRTGRREWYLGAGVALGTGFYTYTAFRLFPLVLLVCGVIGLVRRRPELRRDRPEIGLSLAVAAIVLVPLALYTIHYPGEVFGRAAGVSFASPGVDHGSPLGALASTIGKTALMFNIAGDQNYRQNLGGQPELNIFVGIMFLLGILVSCIRRQRAVYLGVLVVFGVMLLPELLTAEGIPHALRAIGALPPTLVLAAIGTDYLLARWLRVFPLNTSARLAGSAAVALLLGLTVYQGYVTYFVTWANAPQTYAAYSEDTAQLAGYFNTTPKSIQRYAVGGDYTLLPVAFLTSGKASYTRITVGQIAALAPPADRQVQVSVLEGDRQVAIKALKARWPNGRITPHYSAFSGKELFVIYTVPAS